MNRNLKLQNKCGLFTSAAASLMENKRLMKHRETHSAIDTIMQGQRFYLPGDVELFNDEKPDALPAFNLPYASMSVLSEVLYEQQDGSSIMQPVISCCEEKEGGIYLISVIRFSKNIWCPSPVVSVEIVGNEYGLRKCHTPLSDIFDSQSEYNPKEYVPDLNRIQNLLTLLTLHNVRSSIIDPEKKLNQKRQRNGKLPLYSYHVLTVGGDRWDGESTGLGSGYRSHLRRGHVRRISNDRRVWVSATFVRGRLPGFVDKDYNVVAKASSSAERNAIKTELSGTKATA